MGGVGLPSHLPDDDLHAASCCAPPRHPLLRYVRVPPSASQRREHVVPKSEGEITACHEQAYRIPGLRSRLPVRICKSWGGAGVQSDEIGACWGIIPAMVPLDLCKSPRWQPLQRFVARWYLEPLGERSLPVAEVAAVEEALGCRFPRSVEEWYVLVGHRLGGVQDTPVGLRRQTVHDGWIHLWTENQGVWCLAVNVSAEEEDPPAFVDGGVRPDHPSATVSEALLGMVVSDTLVAAWTETGYGPLGKLRPTVVGEFRDDATARITERIRALPALPVWPNPFFPEPPRGHESLVMRECDGCYEWMAATAEAEAEALRILELEEVPSSR